MAARIEKIAPGKPLGFVLALCLLFTVFSAVRAHASGCSFNSIGDYVCPGGGSSSAAAPANPYTPGGDIPSSVYYPGTTPVIMPENPAPLTGEWCSGGASGSSGDKIADGAKKSIGASTANIAGTDGGNLGCAIAVSNMIECSGCGVGSHLSTVSLYNALDKDSCFQKVDTGSINGADLQPGDILVTKTGTRAGHTGIYVGDGKIVSNSSGGFAGSAPGTVQQNYNTSTWSSVTNRNPGGSAVFRRTCDCG